MVCLDGVLSVRLNCKAKSFELLDSENMRYFAMNDSVDAKTSFDFETFRSQLTEQRKKYASMPISEIGRAHV